MQTRMERPRRHYGININNIHGTAELRNIRIEGYNSVVYWPPIPDVVNIYIYLYIHLLIYNIKFRLKTPKAASPFSEEKDMMSCWFLTFSLSMRPPENINEIKTCGVAFSRGKRNWEYSCVSHWREYFSSSESFDSEFEEKCRMRLFQERDQITTEQTFIASRAHNVT